MTDEQIAAATLPQLQAKFVDLGNQVSTLNLVRQKIHARMEELRRAAAAKTRVASLSAAEKAALLKELQQ